MLKDAVLCDPAGFCKKKRAVQKTALIP